MSQTVTIPSPRVLSTEPRRSDKVFRGVVTTGGLSSLVILGVIALFLFYRGYEVLREEGLRFITSADWSITLDESANVVESNFGLSAMLVGTILCALVAVVIAVPISVFSALFLNFYAPQWMKKILVAIIDMMAAFPSILFGIWGFLVLMPSVEYWGKLINKYLGWIPLFEVNPYFFTRSPFSPARSCCFWSNPSWQSKCCPGSADRLRCGPCAWSSSSSCCCSAMRIRITPRAR